MARELDDRKLWSRTPWGIYSAYPLKLRGREEIWAHSGKGGKYQPSTGTVQRETDVKIKVGHLWKVLRVRIYL